MSLSMQETNQTSICSASEATSYVVTSGIPDETYGGSSQTVFMLQPFEDSILDSVKNLWMIMPPGDVKDQMRDLLEHLGHALSEDLLSQSEFSFVPKLHSFPTGNDSALLEWIAPDIRLGFSIESNPSQSSWYLATSDKLGYLSASGQLSEHELPSIVDDLVRFLCKFS